ncbi:peroxiredoxin [Halovenus marina]|uniref:peroxiredoxin n=1 Tax=Halovenus marina TaxID=3396621 RepID=UPI003F57E135
MVLEPGTAVKPIEATTQDGERVSVPLAEPTVLYFYPRDDTPGCTTESTEFDDHLTEFRDAGVAVYGISTDDAESHRAFAEKHDLDVTLLADPDAVIAEAFDVPVENGAAARTTFVCARQQVCGVYEGVQPEGHASAVLEDMRQMSLIE